MRRVRVGAALLRRAHAVHPITALEIEYSLACRFIEAEILPTARELGIGVVAYRVLADGLLSGATAPSPRAHFVAPRMEGHALEQNVRAARPLVDMAARKRCTPAQLAIAWLLARGDNDIVPLVGISRRARLDENLPALDVRVSPDELAQLDAAFAPGAIVGDRYPPFVMKYAAR
ncbi:aldo/keto reductase [Sorangium sp. So ce513]|uniref:aldo/keto reductase n=1 Tax=Sorangium sp. So ce513 TaxID=3133315 RepID=UPI003F5FBAD7